MGCVFYVMHMILKSTVNKVSLSITIFKKYACDVTDGVDFYFGEIF